MNNEPVAWISSSKNLYHSRMEAVANGEQMVSPLYTHPVKEQELLVEIEALKEVNTKQVDYIAEQKSAYEKLWSEHMELFWKHEKDVEEEQEK